VATNPNEVDFSLAFVAPDAATAAAHEAMIRAAFAWAYPDLQNYDHGTADPTHTFDRQLVQHILAVTLAYQLNLGQQQAQAAVLAQFNAAVAQLTFTTGVVGA
jgi:hypothetical protein